MNAEQAALEVEPPRMTRADLVLDEAGGARKHHVGRDRADDDDADVVGRQSRVARSPRAPLPRRDPTSRHPDRRCGASRMPVRCRIHSSVVSTSFSRSALRQHARRHVGRQRRDRRAAARPMRGAVASLTTVVSPFCARRAPSARNSHTRAASRRGRAACDPESRSESETARRCPRSRPSLR